MRRAPFAFSIALINARIIMLLIVLVIVLVFALASGLALAQDGGPADPAACPGCADPGTPGVSMPAFRPPPSVCESQAPRGDVPVGLEEKIATAEVREGVARLERKLAGGKFDDLASDLGMLVASSMKWPKIEHAAQEDLTRIARLAGDRLLTSFDMSIDDRFQRISMLQGSMRLAAQIAEQQGTSSSGYASAEAFLRSQLRTFVEHDPVSLMAGRTPSPFEIDGLVRVLEFQSFEESQLGNLDGAPPDQREIMRKAIDRLLASHVTSVEQGALALGLLRKLIGETPGGEVLDTGGGEATAPSGCTGCSDLLGETAAKSLIETMPVISKMIAERPAEKDGVTCQLTQDFNRLLDRCLLTNTMTKATPWPECVRILEANRPKSDEELEDRDVARADQEEATYPPYPGRFRSADWSFCSGAAKPRLSKEAPLSQQWQLELARFKAMADCVSPQESAVRQMQLVASLADKIHPLGCEYYGDGDGQGGSEEERAAVAAQSVADSWKLAQRLAERIHSASPKSAEERAAQLNAFAALDGSILVGSGDGGITLRLGLLESMVDGWRSAASKENDPTSFHVGPDTDDSVGWRLQSSVQALFKARPQQTADLIERIPDQELRSKLRQSVLSYFQIQAFYDGTTVPSGDPVPGVGYAASPGYPSSGGYPGGYPGGFGGGGVGGGFVIGPAGGPGAGPAQGGAGGTSF